MSRATSYKTAPFSSNQLSSDQLSSGPDAIVIGSGIGGLSVAACLARHGRRVCVLERHYRAGGLTHTFSRKGYTWDVGLHYLGRVHDPDAPLRAAFDYVSEGRLEWARLDPVYDRIVFDDASYDFAAGRGAFRANLVERFPGEVEAIDRYLDLLDEVDETAERYFTQRLVPGPLAKLTRPLLTRAFSRHARRTTAEVLGELTSNRRLIGVLTGRYGNYGLPPASSSFAMHALVAHFYLDGASYPVGGGDRLFETIVPTIRKAGGDVYINAKVDEILVEGRRAVGVRLFDGEELRAPIVISNATLHTTAFDLLPDSSRQRKLADRAAQIEPSTGHICLYLGVDGSAEELGLRAQNTWVHAGYDHDAQLRAFSADPSQPLPMVYINSPSARNPSWRREHPGRSTLTAICPAPYSWFERWRGTDWKRRGEEYDAFKDELRQRLLDTVLEHFPAVAGRIEHQELSTPLSTEHFTAHHRGAAYGLAHTPARFEKPWLRASLPFRGLYLVGQDLVTVGVGASMLSGLLVASRILRRNLLDVAAEA